MADRAGAGAGRCDPGARTAGRARRAEGDDEDSDRHRGHRVIRSRAGLVEGLAQPGGNITGAVQSGRRSRRQAPGNARWRSRRNGCTRVAVLVRSPTNPAHRVDASDVRQPPHGRLRVDIVAVNAPDVRSEIARAFVERWLREQCRRADRRAAIRCCIQQVPEIARQAARQRLPSTATATYARPAASVGSHRRSTRAARRRPAAGVDADRLRACEPTRRSTNARRPRKLRSPPAPRARRTPIDGPDSRRCRRRAQVDGVDVRRPRVRGRRRCVDGAVPSNAHGRPRRAHVGDVDVHPSADRAVRRARSIAARCRDAVAPTRIRSLARRPQRDARVARRRRTAARVRGDARGSARYAPSCRRTTASARAATAPSALRRIARSPRALRSRVGTGDRRGRCRAAPTQAYGATGDARTPSAANGSCAKTDARPPAIGASRSAATCRRRAFERTARSSVDQPEPAATRWHAYRVRWRHAARRSGATPSSKRASFDPRPPGSVSSTMSTPARLDALGRRPRAIAASGQVATVPDGPSTRQPIDGAGDCRASACGASVVADCERTKRDIYEPCAPVTSIGFSRAHRPASLRDRATDEARSSSSMRRPRRP